MCACWSNDALKDYIWWDSVGLLAAVIFTVSLRALHSDFLVSRNVSRVSGITKGGPI